MAIALIHTGGTIGMAQTDNGFAPAEGVIESEVAALNHRQALADTVDIQTLSPLIDSASATPHDWTRIARTIACNYADYDGFVVTHGTDTLAYTAAALCFALEGLSKPVILTGSMLPLTVAGNDGHRNLKEALWSASKASCGVWVQFAGRLLHGARVRKTHSTAFDAFSAGESDAAPFNAARRFRLCGFGDWNVAILSVSPGNPTGLFEYAMTNCDGVVLRCFGSGTAPDKSDLYSALRIARARDMPVVGVSQCPEGGMAMGSYAAGAVLRDNGVLDGRDITVEAAYAKLHHTLEFCSGSARHARLVTPVCGEFGG